LTIDNSHHPFSQEPAAATYLTVLFKLSKMFDLDAGFLIAGSDVDRSTNAIVLMSQFQQEVGNDRTMSWVTLIMAQVVPHPRSDTSAPFQGGKLSASEQQKIEPLTATKAV
jgi:hypothetical protein